VCVFVDVKAGWTAETARERPSVLFVLSFILRPLTSQNSSARQIAPPHSTNYIVCHVHVGVLRYGRFTASGRLLTSRGRLGVGGVGRGVSYEHRPRVIG